MKLINFEESSVKISLDKDELYIIQAIVGEIYSEAYAWIVEILR
ncbi:hypothetical protein [Neisseria lactamica]|nr:hypothetical protein [Neisseria lactamica]